MAAVQHSCTAWLQTPAAPALLPVMFLFAGWRLLGVHLTAGANLRQCPGCMLSWPSRCRANCMPCPGCRLEVHLCATLLRLLQWAPACSSLLAENLVPLLVQRAVTALDRCNGRDGSELLSMDAELLSALLKVSAWYSAPCHKLSWQEAAGEGMEPPPRAMHVSSRCLPHALAIVTCMLMLSDTTTASHDAKWLC